MKRLSFIVLAAMVIGYWSLVIPQPASAQPVYMGFYWVAGQVSDPNGYGTEGRWVVIYRDDTANGYADDYAGVNGLARRANEFMVNALEEWRWTLTPGQYYAAIVNDNPTDMANGIGAGPVQFNITGAGYDFVNLTLARGAGILPPAARPSPLEAMLPRIDDIRFGNRLYQPALVAKGQDFVISSSPRVTFNVVSAFGVNTSSIAMVLNEGTVNAKTYTVQASDIISAAGAAELPSSVAVAVDFSARKETLPEGTQNLTFRAANTFGDTQEVCTVMVAGGEPRLIGIPLTYPSPVHLKTDKQVTFQYTLSHDINVDLFLFDVAGRIVKKYSYMARTEGGSAGVNKPTWDLQTDQGAIVASGIYVFTLVNKDNGKLLGKGKFTCLP